MFNSCLFCRGLFIVTLLSAQGLLAGCDDSENLPVINVTSPSFGNGETIPDRHTCYGEGISPQLYFHDAPKDTAQFVVVVDDQESPEGLTTHWLLWGIEGDSAHVPQEIEVGAESQGFFQGVTDNEMAGYFPPCPPKAEEHEYRFRVFALSGELVANPGATRPEVIAAMEGLTIGYGELIGLYQK